MTFQSDFQYPVMYSQCFQLTIILKDDVRQKLAFMCSLIGYSSNYTIKMFTELCMYKIILNKHAKEEIVTDCIIS